MIVISRLVISSEIVYSNQAPQCPSKRLGQTIQPLLQPRSIIPTPHQSRLPLHPIVGFNVTITSPPPYPSFHPTSPDVTLILTANADTHLQKYEKKKIGRNNKTDPATGIITVGDTLLGDLLTHNMVLIPLAIDPHGRFGPLLQTFLFDTEPATPISFTTNKPKKSHLLVGVLNGLYWVFYLGWDFQRSFSNLCLSRNDLSS